MASVARNAPCPCGSGKKYKQCCLIKTVDIKRAGLAGPLAIALAGLGVGVYTAATRSVALGFSVGAGLVIVAGLIWMFRDPPPPAGSGRDPGAINFGG